MDARDRCRIHAYGNRTYSEEPTGCSRPIARARFHVQVFGLAGCRTRFVPSVVGRPRPGARRMRSGNAFVGTRVIAPAFSYLRTIEDGNERMVDQNSASWNPLISWLRQVSQWTNGRAA